MVGVGGGVGVGVGVGIGVAVGVGVGLDGVVPLPANAAAVGASTSRHTPSTDKTRYFRMAILFPPRASRGLSRTRRIDLGTDRQATGSQNAKPAERGHVSAAKWFSGSRGGVGQIDGPTRPVTRVAGRVACARCH